MNKHVESITGVVAVKRLVKVVCIAGAAIMLAGCGSDATTEAVDSAQPDEATSEVDALDPAQSDEATSEVETVEDGNVESTDDAQVDGEPTEDTAPETVPPVTADDIPVAHTPPGGYGDIMPAPVLSSCTEPLSDEAVDMRGMWQIVGPENEGDAPTGAVQRIEQCGNRMVITSGGAVHDMRVDGTLDNGVNDVAARDFTTPARVAAFWEDGVHVLRPDGLPIEVTRHLDGDQLIWRYFDFSARLDRIGPVDMEVDALDPPQSDVATSEVDAVDSATVEGANAQVLYHDSYWVTEVEVPNSPDVNVINDMYVDLDTMRVTVYAQTRVLVDRIVAPPQVDPGECTDTLLGDRVCHHPDAVYLNGSGQELETSDGTGEWWVKHSWILGGEGYDNCPLESAEVYENCFYVEGELMDDGVSMRIGGIEPGFEDFFNVRGPVLDRSPIEYQVRRHEPAEDGSGPVETFTLTWQCEEAVSAFDGSDRTCRDS